MLSRLYIAVNVSNFLSNIVIHNRTINTKGILGHGKPIDMALEHHNLIIRNAFRSSGCKVTEHHLSFAAQMPQDCAELCELQVQSPFRSYQHTSTEVHHDIKQMISHLRGQGNIINPRRKLPPNKAFAMLCL